MLTFRPDVRFFASEETFPSMQEALLTEDFLWAIWNCFEPSTQKAELVLNLAIRARKISHFYEADLPALPSALVVPIFTCEPTDFEPIPLLITRSNCGKPILGVLSDALPESVCPSPTNP